MALSNGQIPMALRLTKRMMSKGVIGQHHKQIQTVAGWFPSHEEGDAKDVLKDMVSDRDAPVVQKGRGTVQLISWEAGARFLEKHGGEPPTKW